MAAVTEMSEAVSVLSLPYLSHSSNKEMDTKTLYEVQTREVGKAKSPNPCNYKKKNKTY